MSIITTILSITTALTMIFSSAPALHTEASHEDLAAPYCPTTLCLTDSPALYAQAFSTLEASDEVRNLEVPADHDTRYTLLGYINAPEYTDPTTLDTIEVTDSEGTTFIFSYSFESTKLYTN